MAKRKSVAQKASPFKAPALALGAGLAYVVGKGMYEGYKRRKRAQVAIRNKKKDVDRLKGDFADLSTSNLYAGVTNPYADIQTNFENVYEDMVGVDTTGADMANEQFQQNLATTLDQMRQMGMVNVQQLARATQEQDQRTRADLGQQIRQSQILQAQGAEKVQAQEQAAEMKVAEGQHQAEMTRIQGAVDARNLEYQKTQGLLALEAAELESMRANKIANKNWFQRVFSDVRLKKNIKLVGKSTSGLNIYTFEYKNPIHGEGVYQGVMSNEVPAQAVSKNENGYDMVDYSQLDVDFIKI